MRKPRDFDAELQALNDKARTIKARRQAQLGELVTSTGAADLDIDILAGALIDAARADAGRKEAWRKSGVAFFHGNSARARKSAGRHASGASQGGAGAQPPSGEAGAA
ncbi:MAG TPA: conjugal transfer protein TraD [Sphingopyxis sp.]|nr:conjugal transfer protein TraD [Sphingopyxis sp.]HMQ20234.1 conjugal transfer protein TraD [Sphingopyxis sp.]